MAKNFREILKKFPDARVNSWKFNKIFQIDGIPLWYFLEPLMKAPYIPSPFRSLDEIENDAKEGVTPSWADDLKLSILRKGLIFNEKLKIMVSRAARKRLSEGNPADILFLSYTNQVFDKDGKLDFLGFGDVIKDLEGSGVKPMILFCDPVSKNSLFRLKRFECLLYSFVDSGIIRESRAMAKKLAEEWKKLDKKTLFTYQGRDYWKFLRSEMNFLFSREMLETIIMYYLTFKKIIKQHDIKLVYLTGIIGIYESALLGAVSKLNKKIVYSPHGYGGYAVPLYLRENFYKNFVFAAAGDGEKKKLLDLGIKERNIFVTGSPFFDKIVEYRIQREKSEDKKTVTLITSALVEYKFIEKNEYFDYIRRYLSQISKVKNVGKIIIKLHPDEKYKSEYESIARSLKLGNVRVIQKPGKEVLYSILRDSDLLITFGSTAAVEGLMLGKDVVVIEGFMGDLCRADPYKKAVLKIEKEDDLGNVVEKILTNKKERAILRKKREEYIRTEFYKIDGKAHKRVADLIVSMLKMGAKQ